mmetsp:Transcript_1764/g.5207  ORF Transcript_1764/g.5207 Transcript_1764/m.5207 type:complete len:203 (-) Transcript_1764:527-1135(-)
MYVQGTYVQGERGSEALAAEERVLLDDADHGDRADGVARGDDPNVRRRVHGRELGAEGHGHGQQEHVGDGVLEVQRDESEDREPERGDLARRRRARHRLEDRQVHEPVRADAFRKRDARRQRGFPRRRLDDHRRAAGREDARVGREADHGQRTREVGGERHADDAQRVGGRRRQRLREEVRRDELRLGQHDEAQAQREDGAA